MQRSVAEDDNHQLPIENSLDLLILLLYSPGVLSEFNEAIEGITRLQKLVFLLQQGKGPQELVEHAMQHQFKAYKMGPYSEKLRDEIEELRSAGLVKTERLTYWITDDADDEPTEELDRLTILTDHNKPKKIESRKYVLTDIGKEIGNELWNSLTEKQMKAIVKFKRFFGGLSLRQLLILVYENYPEYAKESEIRESLF